MVGKLSTETAAGSCRHEVRVSLAVHSRTPAGQLVQVRLLSITSMVTIIYASNAISVSIPIAGSAMSAAFSFRAFARRGADRGLAGWVLAMSGVISTVACSDCGRRRHPVRERRRRSGRGVGRLGHRRARPRVPDRPTQRPPPSSIGVGRRPRSSVGPTSHKATPGRPSRIDRGQCGPHRRVASEGEAAIAVIVTVGWHCPRD